MTRLKLEDLDVPRLRLIPGTMPLPLIRQTHAGRLATWEKWAHVSNATQGAPGYGGIR
jgi:hypothetical protein